VVLLLTYQGRDFTHTLREGATDKPIKLPTTTPTVQIVRNGVVVTPAKQKVATRTSTYQQSLARGGTGYNGEALPGK
jgi:hypothetical protein